MGRMRLNFIGILMILLLIVLSIMTAYFYLESKKSTDLEPNVSEETEKIINEVSKLIFLPEDEAPTLATVSDPEKIKEQPFFSKAKKGDKILIYLVARKAYLYDPVAKKLVEVASLSAENTSSINSTVSTTTDR